LSLLPQHAVSRCRQQELRDAFIKMIFTETKFEVMKLDFQQCVSWEHVYQQMTYRAGSSSTWYTDAPKHKTTPDISVSPNVSSSSPAGAAGTGDKAVSKEHSKEASEAYWKQELARLQRTVKHDASILQDVATDKKKAKLLQKLKYRQTLEAEIRDQVNQALLRDKRRDHSRDNGRDHQQRQQRFHQDRPDYRSSREQSQERTYEHHRHHDRPPQDERRLQDTRFSRSGSQSGGSHGGGAPVGGFQSGGQRRDQHDQRNEQRDHSQRPRTPPPPAEQRSQAGSPSKFNQQASRADSRSRSPGSNR
jgi:hypothetical protein